MLFWLCTDIDWGLPTVSNMGSFLLSFAVLCILGTAQAGYELSKQTMETIIISQEPKCCDRTLYMYDSVIYSALGTLKEFQEAKITSINIMEYAESVFKRCSCGKEYEDKKCQDEMSEAFRKLRDDKICIQDRLPYYYDVLRNATEAFAQSLGEMRYYCKGYGCPQKVECYESRFIEYKEICKEPKYNKEARALLDFAPGYLSRLRTTAVLLDVCIKNMQEIINMREYVPKDGQCKDYKLVEMIDITAVNLARQLPIQRILNSEDSPYIIKTSQEGLKALACCGKTYY